MRKKIGITAWGSVSALGIDKEIVARNYLDEKTYLRQAANVGAWTGSLAQTPLPQIDSLSIKRFKEKIDRSVLLSLLAADQLWSVLDWDTTKEIGINIGSSRGATTLWEHYYRQFAFEEEEHLSSLASPTTTLGNISSWLGAYLGIQGPSISHSVTCSSASQAIINGIAWLESGRCQRFLAGGSEAPLTAFTLAQMKALRIYAPNESVLYPCKGLDETQVMNSMVLGEGAALFALELNPPNALAWIKGIGYAQEIPNTPTSVSADGKAFQLAMQQALREYGEDQVDVIVCHAPGTRRGDAAELQAIQAVFGTERPVLTGNKWKLGHTLGASGALSLEMAILMLQHNSVFPIPFLNDPLPENKSVNSVMINAMGFGGNAVSIIISR